jgi:hypothetical protein
LSEKAIQKPGFTTPTFLSAVVKAIPSDGQFLVKRLGPVKSLTPSGYFDLKSIALISCHPAHHEVRSRSQFGTLTVRKNASR